MYYTKGLGKQHSASRPPAGMAGLPRETWEELRKPFPDGAVIYHNRGRVVRGWRIVAEAMPDPERLLERLDRVLGIGGYSYWHEVVPGGSAHTATCHLQIGGAVRSGVYADSNPEKAAALALVRAAQAFHIGWQARAVGQFVAHLPAPQEGDVPEEVNEKLDGKGLTPPPLGPEEPPAKDAAAEA